MTGRYEGEGFALLASCHRVEEAARRGVTAGAGALDPMHGYADRCPSQHRQVQGRGAVAHAAAVFAGADVQAQVQPSLDAPVAAVGLQQRDGCQRRGRAGGEQVFGVDLFGGVLGAVEAAGQPGGLFDEGEADGFGGGVEGDEAAGFGAAAVDFTGLDDARRVQRGKRRATGFGEVVARCRPRPFGCL